MMHSEISIGLCGHAKHGKSTLAGRLLVELGGVRVEALSNIEATAEQEIPNFGKFAADFNKYSLLFLLSRPHTFSRPGVHDDPSRSVFPVRGSALIGTRRITVIDTPGVSRFLDNIIYGVYLSDACLMVVEASDGVSSGTLTAAKILAAFEIPVIGVCITKMDIVDYKRERFEAAAESVRTRLCAAFGFGDVPVIPVAALEGTGVVQGAGRCEWYRGPTVTDVIKGATVRGASAKSLPARFVVEGRHEVFSPDGIGTVLVGALETGELAVGDVLVIEPASTAESREITCTVRSLGWARGVGETKPALEKGIAARAIISVALRSDLGHQEARYHFRHGGVLGPREEPPRTARRIAARVLFFDSDAVYAGKRFLLRGNPAQAECSITQISDRDKLIDLANLEFGVQAGEEVDGILELDRPICIEEAAEFGRLTRFVLRGGNQIVACGRCTGIMDSAAAATTSIERGGR